MTENQSIKEEVLNRILDDINAMGEELRPVYIKSVLEGKSWFKIAGELGITVDSVRLKLAIARRLVIEINGY